MNDFDAFFREWSDAIGAGDPRRVSALTAEDAIFLANGAEPLSGRANVERQFSSLAEANSLEQSFAAEETVDHGEYAFVRGLESFRITPRDGVGVTQIRQRVFLILRRGPERRWQFWRVMTNQPPE